jgi:CelD/BcsL family acetyltransferase involved in cellulose biosynthesis
MGSRTSDVDTVPFSPAVSLRLHAARIATDEQLLAVAAAWDELSDSMPFRMWDWQEAWWRHYRTLSDELFIVTVRNDDGDLLGLAPFYLSRSKRRGRVLRLLGSGVVASDYLSILSAPGYEQTVVRTLADWLVSEAGHDWHAIELSGVDRDDLVVTSLLAELEERGNLVRRCEGLSCWPITLPATWDDYLMELSKDRRQRTRKLVRQQFDSGRARLCTIDSPEDLWRVYDIFCDLHQRRRTSLGEGGCFSCSRFAGFLQEVTQRFYQLGQLRLLYVELDGRPVATEYGLTQNGQTIYVYQSGLDPSVADERPGWLGTISSIQRALDEGFRTYDLLRGDEAYKSHWRAVARPLLEARVIRGTAAGRLYDQLDRQYERGKSWLKRGLGHLGYRRRASANETLADIARAE